MRGRENKMDENLAKLIIKSCPRQAEEIFDKLDELLQTAVLDQARKAAAETYCNLWIVYAKPVNDFIMDEEWVNAHSSNAIEAHDQIAEEYEEAFGRASRG